MPENVLIQTLKKYILVIATVTAFTDVYVTAWIEKKDINLTLPLSGLIQ